MFIATPVQPLSSLLVAAVLTAVPAAALAQSATIEGTVTESGSGIPLNGVTVAVSDPNFYRQTLVNGTTDALGQYSISVSMAPGETRDLIVEAAGPAHAPSRHAFAGALPCFFNCGSGGEISVTEGSTFDNIDIALDIGGRVSGTITEASSGNPIVGASARLVSPDLAEYSLQFSGISQTDGSYMTPLAVVPGTYYMRANGGSQNYVTQAWNGYPCELGVCPIADSDSLTIAAGSIASGFDFALEPGATLSGNLLPDDILKVILVFNAAGRRLALKVITAAELPETGWSFDGLAGGSYYVQLGPVTGASSYIRILHNRLLCPFSGCERARGTPLAIPSGANLSLAPIILDQGGQIEGTIIDGSTGLPPAGVPSAAVLGNYDIIDSSGIVVGGGRIQEDSGSIIMRTSSSVPPGNYHVRTYSEFLGESIGAVGLVSNGAIDGYMDAIYPDVPCAGIDCDLPSAGTVTVTTGGVASITIEIETGSAISGQVVDQSTSVPISNAFVRTLNAAGDTIARVVTDENGRYKFGALPAGSYFVRTSMSGHAGPGHSGFQNAYFDKVNGAAGHCSESLCDPSSGAAIVLDGNSDVDAGRLEVISGPVISGQIIDLASGFPVGRGGVEVFTDTGEFVGRYKVNFAEARYQTTALPPGTYTLVPVVSPAYGSVTPGGGTSPARLGRDMPSSGFEVVVGVNDVDADLQIVDLAIDRLFSDQFGEAF